MGERTRELLILIIGDTICFVTAVWLTLFVRYLEWPSVENVNAHLGPFLILTAVWLFLFFSAGLYDKHTMLLKQALRNRLLYTQLANFFIALLLFLIIPFGIAPKTNLVIYLVISTGLLSWWRLYGFNYFSTKERHKALLIADGEEAINLVDEINNNDRYNYFFIRIIDKKVATETPDFESKLLRLIEREEIKIVVAGKESTYAASILPTIFDLAFLRFRCTLLDFTNLYEDTFDRVPISALGYEWFITNIAQSSNPIYDFSKRAIDILGVLVLAIPTIIIFPLVAMAIKLDDKGLLFYYTERVGRFNELIRLYKFRTKNGVDVGDAALKSVLVDTRVGAFLRKTRLDELPQLYNVLKGDLSFIGPRPEMPALASIYAEQIPYYNTRHFIKPGLSGWAQINDFDAPRGGVDIERTKTKLSYDLLYLKRRSLLLDVQIAIKTLTTLVMRTGK